MQQKKNVARNNEQGVIITLVAVFLLGVVGAMAALSIDVVTLYTARSEAQLAADAAALAGARVLANSGITSNTADAMRATNAENIASSVAIQVARNNEVGGRNLKASEITVTFLNAGGSDPEVSVRVQRTDLPTFFARIWGTTQIAVAASATAEAYNPSGTSGVPVAPICVKPWLLPNVNPTQANAAGPQIFDPTTGAIQNATLVSQGWPNASYNNGLHARAANATPLPGRYYAGQIDAADFPAPTQSLPACATGYTDPYQLAIAGCVTRPISCGSTATINIDPSTTSGNLLNIKTLPAAECLIHYNGNSGDTDSIDSAALPTPSFQFIGGNQNPVPNAVGNHVLVSDSLVTIPVYNSTPGVVPTNPVTVIGFLQVFLNPQSATLPASATAGPNQVPVTIINLVGCGTSASATPILGNGASPVAVRLISSP